MKNLIFISTMCFAIIAGGCGKKSGSEDEGGGERAKATVAVKATTVRRGDMDVIIRATGKVDALRKQKLFSPVAGRVTSLMALEGISVKPGDILAIIQTKESQAAIVGAESLVRSAKTDEQKAEAQRALEMAKSSENSIALRASVSGIVSTRSISEGELVAENAELFTVIDLATMMFVADVPARDLPSLVLGQRCSISLQAFGGRLLSAEVEAVNPQSDVMSQTVKVRLKLLTEDPAKRKLLKTDMTGDVTITTGVLKGVFIVPKAALLRNDESNSYTVVTFTPDSLSVSVSVEVRGMTDSTVAIVDHILKEGMNVITEGHYALADSTRITVAQ
ncbi:MAG: efflux RND transporter periplasmic adaptor subunit [Ignavibacteriales bacterium]|nr:efflux RND transporter periplasmic adaptor subunit [Ignavibacteriales bacterium]